VKPRRSVKTRSTSWRRSSSETYRHDSPFPSLREVIPKGSGTRTARLWRYTGMPCSGSSCVGWQLLDNNPAAAVIAAAGRQLFQLHNDGTIWRYIGTPCSGSVCPGWQMLDNNPQAAAAAAGNELFQLHRDGTIWRYTGTPCSGAACAGWWLLDNNPVTKAVTAGPLQ
jgi:hypothetical protein